MPRITRYQCAAGALALSLSLAGCGPGAISGAALQGTILAGASVFETGDMCFVAGSFAYAARCYDLAEQCAMASIKASEAADKKGPGLARAWRELGMIRSAMGTPDSAEEAFSEAAALFESLGDDWKADAAEACAYTAFARFEQARYEDAEQIVPKAIALIASSPENASENIAQSWILIGRVLQESQTRWEESKNAFDKALEIAEALGGDGEKIKVYANASMSDLLTRQGALPQAEEYAKKALESAEAVGGGYQLYTVTCYNNLGVIRLRQGQLREASDYFDEALAEIGRRGREEDIEMAKTLHGKAFCLYKWKYYSESKSFMRRAAAILEKRLGPNHPELARVLADLGSLCKSAGELEEARSLMNRAREIYAQRGGAYAAEVEHIDQVRATL